MDRYPKLFSPIRLGPMELENRILLAPMSTGFGYEEGAPTARMVEFVRARSGGVGLATVAFGAVRPEGRLVTASPWMWREDAGALMAPLAEAIHERGARASLQLAHAGRLAHEDARAGDASLVPSGGGPDSRAPGTDEVRQIVTAFATAAARAAEAGFDAVEIHAGHGHLLHEFLDPSTNHRTDEYGSDRMRLGVEIVQAVLTDAPSLAVLVRLNATDRADAEGPSADPVEIATRFDQAGADAIVVTAGRYGATPGPLPLLDEDEGTFLRHASLIRKRTGATVFGVGKITLPDTAEQAIARGDVDGVAVGRALLADPDWVAKAREGRLADIRPCIATVQGCAGLLQTGGAISCAVNPRVGHEGDAAAPSPAPRVVAVVGGGPAGMEAARRAAELGHRVTLLERDRHLGGQVRWAAATPPLRHFERLIEWYERQLEEQGVTVRVRVEGTPRSIAALDADDVILATGADAVIPDLPGTDLLPTWSLDGVLAGAASTTGSTGLPAALVVAGGGTRAMATALWAADAGAYVTLLDPGDTLDAQTEVLRSALLARCERAGVRMRPGRVDALEEDGVIVDGDLVPAAGLVVAEESRTGGTDLGGIRIGDAREPRGIATAILEGRSAAEALGRT